ncbi:MAG: hypothetical protein EHM65_11590 [Acidobacteriales bacterium]|nr:MAG: hypothetical protein EHM65_11590 [Terriglobales bacterium]
MSWQIPTQIEQDIICGKAKYQTYQVGFGGQNILPVAPNSYVVIFGYDFSPAGGGLRISEAQGGTVQDNTPLIRWFETQQISFYTGTDFYPFIHHVNTEYVAWYNSASEVTFGALTIDSSPIARQLYITSTNDVTISVGLILTGERDTAIAIPVTGRTPFNLTYGGSGQLQNEFTDLGGAPNVRFVQPTQKNAEDFGVLGANDAVNQTYWGPDVNNGMLDPTQYLNSLGSDFRNAAACNYFLCLHYAIYNKTVPETRG